MIAERGQDDPGPAPGLLAAGLRREEQPNQAAAVGQVHSEPFLAARPVILQWVLLLGCHSSQQLVEGEAAARRSDDDPAVGITLDIDACAFAQTGADGQLARYPHAEAVAPFPDTRLHEHCGFSGTGRMTSMVYPPDTQYP